MNTRILLATLLVALCLSSCSKWDESPRELTLDLGKGVMMKLVRIPAGKFLMGSKFSPEEIALMYRRSEEGHANANEHPRHEVTISKPFYMGVCEITQAQWRTVTGAEPCDGRCSSAKLGTDNAACCISWDDANRFCEILSKKIGKKVALPSEAQWEYACRAGSKTIYCFGDDISKLVDYAWYCDNAEMVRKGYAQTVGQKKPNAWGLYDMHGNVWEWCRDWYDEKYYARAKRIDPENTTEARLRVLRGGSFLDNSEYCRAANRIGWTTNFVNRSGRVRSSGGYHSGFRVVVIASSGAD